jgi:type I restriction enzyme S subunit
MGNIAGGQLQLDDLKFLPATHDEFPKLLLHSGDVLFNRTNSPELVGKTAVYNGHPTPCSFASYLLRIKLVGYEPKLLSSYINSSHGKAWVASAVSQQVGQANVNSTKLKAFRIPVPPLTEQRRITSKLESLLARSRRAKEALDAIPALLERFRQSVLAAAFRGDLTADWRAQHPDAEPASNLLERIRAERRRRWEEAELEKMRANGNLSKNDSWKAKYEEPASIDFGPLPELPEKWCWASVDDLLPATEPLCYGVVQPGSETEGGIPLVRVCDLADGTVAMEQLRTISAAVDEEYARSRLNGGEVLISVVGTIARVAIAPPEARGANIARAVARLSFTSSIPVNWAAAWLSAPYMQDRLNRDAREVARKTLNLSTLQRAPIPLAPLEEMSKLVTSIVNSIDSAHRVENAHKVIQKTSDTLEPALLAKAFRGELVPQDPNDEPATVLLERIRAEREATAGSAPKRSRGRRPAA